VNSANKAISQSEMNHSQHASTVVSDNMPVKPHKPNRFLLFSCLPNVSRAIKNSVRRGKSGNSSVAPQAKHSHESPKPHRVGTAMSVQYEPVNVALRAQQQDQREQGTYLDNM
jgi:hypothetical protein